MNGLLDLGQNAKAAAALLATLSAEKNKALGAIREELLSSIEEIISQNALDLQAGREKGLTKALLDRLTLNEARIRAMAQGIDELIAMPDPIGEVLSGSTRPNGLRIKKVRVPLGVIGIIFEARPNVTVDAAALCLKAGNAVILRGGKEAIHSNICLSELMRRALGRAGLPCDCIQLVHDTSRQSSYDLMDLTEYLDVLIPRGGAGLIRAVVENAHVPVIETGVGNCHVYVDEYADVDMAASIIDNAKTSRPSVCNAIETILVHKAIAKTALPVIAERLLEKNVELRGCEGTRAILGDRVVLATEEDFAAEFLDYILAVKVVDGFDEAIGHIRRYSSGHSECIVTENIHSAERFVREIDAAAVYVNASTRFTDGAEFGLGAEIGISTQKLHARGPMGLNELTSMKFIVQGDGQIR